MLLLLLYFGLEDAIELFSVFFVFELDVFVVAGVDELDEIFVIFTVGDFPSEGEVEE